MPAIELPTRPGIKNATPRLIDWGGRLVPILGGPVQTINRLGTRWSLEFRLPPVPSEPYGREWAGKLAQAKLDGALARFIQDGFSAGSPGTPVVDGAGQTGMTLAIRSGRANYTYRYGQFLSVWHDRWYLYMITAPTRLDASGAGELPLFPMLRRIHSDADPLEVARPYIQGSLIGDERAWDITDDPFMDFGSIRIDEDE
jgi:hypothetical protein